MGSSRAFRVAGLAAVIAAQSVAPASSSKGMVDAVAHLLKNDDFRQIVWGGRGVKELILKVQQGPPSPIVNKSIVCVWLLSFEGDILKEFEKFDAATKLQDVFQASRVEKVIRISLAALRNCLKNQSLATDIVEQGTLEALQQLEYEEWRDAELYDDIQDMCSQLGTRVSELSNFDRYEKELSTGNPQWGFIHSEKFWNESDHEEPVADTMVGRILHFPLALLDPRVGDPNPDMAYPLHTELDDGTQASERGHQASPLVDSSVHITTGPGTGHCPTLCQAAACTRSTPLLGPSLEQRAWAIQGGGPQTLEPFGRLSRAGGSAPLSRARTAASTALGDALGGGPRVSAF
jgi:hypothetical protein